MVEREISEGERLSFYNIDKILIFLFVVFLVSGEAQHFLNRSEMRWAYLRCSPLRSAMC